MRSRRRQAERELLVSGYSMIKGKKSETDISWMCVRGKKKELTSSKVLWVSSLISLHNRSPSLPIDIITRYGRFPSVGNLDSPLGSHNYTQSRWDTQSLLSS